MWSFFLYCVLKACDVIFGCSFCSVTESNNIVITYCQIKSHLLFLFLVMQKKKKKTGSPLPNGDAHLHSSAKRKLAEDRGYVFDKRLRYNVRQSETNYRFRDIVVRKEEGFTHVLLSSQTSDNNALTPEVCRFKRIVPHPIIDHWSLIRSKSNLIGKSLSLELVVSSVWVVNPLA